MDMKLTEYIENQIIPRYADFDSAHREDHVRSVIEQSLAMTEHYDVNEDIVYVAAACHDLGLAEGREKHHLASARIIREDANLRKWFTQEQIELIAQAAEDHRASSATSPRSIYGRILAEADRLIDPETVIRRTVQYGFSNYPEMSRKQMWERFLEHLNAKYAQGGYLKLWIPESPNAHRLEALRTIIADRAELRRRFDRYYRQEKYAPAVCERFLNDEYYRKGHINIVAAKPGTLILGLHTPQMKAFAKEAARRQDWRETLEDLAEWAAVSPLSHDERIIWGLTIDYVKCGIDERIALIRDFLPYIDNWAICDQFCCNSAWAKRSADEAAVRQFIRSCLASKEEFARRAGIVLMISNFLSEGQIGTSLADIKAMKLQEGEPFYVRMGTAWLLATALAKDAELTRAFVAEAQLPADIVKLYVRKARESYRTREVSPF